MIKDIHPPKVENVAVAIVKEQNELAQDEWNAYLLNLKNEPLDGVLVACRGYGSHNGKEVVTTQIRYFLDEMPAKSYKKIEPIHEELFGLSNQYWVSFYIRREIYDKKYIFLPDSVVEDFMIELPLMGKRGVLIR